MADITKRFPDCDDEGERGERGKRGRRGPPGPINTGPTYGLGPTIVGILQPEFADPPQTVTIYARTTGSDLTGDGSLGNPYATMQHAVRNVPGIVPPGTRYVVDITGITEVLPQDYTLPAWVVPDSVSNIAADNANPFGFALTGITIFATPQLVPLGPTPANADAIINLADVNVVSAMSGPGLKTIAPNIFPGVALLTDLAGGFDPTRVGGGTITISGAAAGNNGAFPVLFVASTTQIFYANPGAVAEVLSPFTWQVDLFDVVSDPATQLRTVTLDVARFSWGVGGLKGKFTIDSATNTANAVIFQNTLNSISITTNQTLTFPLRIMEPSATLSGSALRKGTLAAINIGSIGFVGLRISTPGQQGLYLDNPGGYATCVLCELNSPGAPPQFGSFLPTRLDLSQACWIRGTVHLSSYRSVFCRNTFFDACQGIDSRNLLTFEDCKSIFFTRCVFDGCEAIAPVNHVAFFGIPRNQSAATVAWWWFDHSVVRNCLNPTAAIFFSGVYAYFFLLDVYGNTGSGILCSAGAGTLHLDNVRTMGGAANGNLGIEMRHGMRALATSGTFNAPGGTQLRGLNGDMKVGFLPIRSWLNFATVVPLQNEFDITSVAASGAIGSGSQIIASTP